MYLVFIFFVALNLLGSRPMIHDMINLLLCKQIISFERDLFGYFYYVKYFRTIKIPFEFRIKRYYYLKYIYKVLIEIL